VKKRPDLLAGEDLPSDPRQKRSADKRERLKEAGLGLFGEKGYESTSIEAIAQRANLAVGSFYQHYRSKRQLLLALMDELLERLSQLELRPEAALTDASLARKQKQIHTWTTGHVAAVFERLAQLPGARKGLDLPELARGMDALFWSLLGQAVGMPKPELDRWVDSCTHLIYHALFTDSLKIER
jgi:hypothetical protein